MILALTILIIAPSRPDHRNNTPLLGNRLWYNSLSEELHF